MEIYDSLVFDFRKPEDLFNKENSGQVFYADIIKRWVNGAVLSENESNTLAGILIYFPEYVENHNKTLQFIEYIRQALLQPQMRKNDHPEKGLYLYTLVYFLLKSGNVKEAIDEISNLKNLISEYNTNEIEIFEIFTSDGIENNLTRILSVDSTAYSTDEFKLAQAYFKIISMILESEAFLALYPDCNLSNFPVPLLYINDYDCIEIRSTALGFYNKKEYNLALKCYRILRLYQFDIPGTLTHFARVELKLGNVRQAEIYVSMAWNERKKAAPYVMSRILLLIVFLKLIQAKEVDIWIACLKQSLKTLKNNDYWQIEEVIQEYKKKLIKKILRLYLLYRQI